MTPKRQRMWFAIFGVGFLCLSTLLILNAFREHLVFFYTPSDLSAKNPPAGQLMRLGGLVEGNSVVQDGTSLSFVVTDLKAQLAVHFTGLPPALFREGQGVVAEGYVEGDGFRAVKLLAKHDENYMPPEVAAALRESGEWKGPEAARSARQ